MDINYIQTISFNDADSLLKAINYGGELYNLMSGTFIFRGHYSNKYKLVPYALRNGGLNSFLPTKDIVDERSYLISQLEFVQMISEYQLLHKFYNTCDRYHLKVPECPRLREGIVKGYDPYSFILRENWLPKEFWEVAALAQHYGVPTRLLDWTYNFNTALYFAIKDYVKPLSANDVLLRTETLLKKRGKGEEPYCEIWAMDTKVVVAKEGKLPLVLIRPPYNGNPNLAAQEGVFTLWSLIKPVHTEGGKWKFDTSFKDDTPLDQLLVEKLNELSVEEKTYIYRISFPRQASIEIYEYLKRLGHTAAMLFPGYDGVTLAMKEDNAFGDKTAKTRIAIEN
jgi:hypothetical protein